MKAVVVQYRTKADSADENQELIEAVFREIDERRPVGFSYRVFRLEDGVSFVHTVVEHEVENPDSLADLPAFQAFTKDIADRCEVAPAATGATVVGTSG
jgi:hypothetical protein